MDVYETVDFDGGDRRVTVLRQLISGDPGFEKSGRRGEGKGEEKTTQTATIGLRGGPTTANNNLDDLESAIDDGINLVGFVLWQRRFVPGAGKTELELARRVNLRAGKMKGQQRYVVKRFATALEVIHGHWRRTLRLGRGRRTTRRVRGKTKPPNPLMTQNHPPTT